MTKRLKVLFVHPDLGIGGAERLVVDAAISLQELGHSVEMITSHHDKNHCFQETKDGTLKVQVFGDWIPRHIFGQFYIVGAIARSLWTACWLVALYLWSTAQFLARPPAPAKTPNAPKPRPRYEYDVIFVDQLSVCIPLLRLTGAQILFYCHFPDQLLSVKRGLLKQIYRMPIDWLEETTTGMSHRVLVNSQFTASVYNATFRRIAPRLVPEVLYPAINFSKYGASKPLSSSADSKLMFLSINRYERKKNIGLAVRAFASVIKQLKGPQAAAAQLVIAGGYDPRVRENVEHYEELKSLAASLSLSTSDHPDYNSQVVFVRSFSEEQRTQLLDQCISVVYTPTGEHFGIVPVEAMFARRPVIAVNVGGPVESVRDGSTGFLCDPEVDAFAAAMMKLVTDPAAARAMGERGRQNVLERFSLQAFGSRLNEIVTEMSALPKRSAATNVLSVLCLALAPVAGIVAAVMSWR